MTHLLLGLDPKYVREEPYIPTISVAPKLVGAELGLHVNAQARVHLLPSIGSYVGGDITAGVISSGLYTSDRLTPVHRHRHQRRDRAGHQGLAHRLRLLGRTGLRRRRRRPRHARQLRGHRGRLDQRGDLRADLPHGRQRAAAGRLRQRPHRPAGRALHHRRASTSRGTSTSSLEHAARARGQARSRVRHRLGVRARASGTTSRVTETDIDNLLRAKAAIYAGFSVLCRSVGVDLARRRADPDRRRLRAVHQRREGDPHRPAPRPAAGALPFPGQHQRPGRLRHAPLRQLPSRRPRRRRQDDLPGALGRQQLHGRVHIGPLPASHPPRRLPQRQGAARHGRAPAGRGRPAAIPIEGTQTP